MFKTTVAPTFTPKRVTFAEMKSGQIGRVVSSVCDIYTGDIVLRAYDALVSLTTEGRSWANVLYNTNEVELLPRGTKITIEVTE